MDTEVISYNLDATPGYEFFRVLDRKPTSLGREAGWQLKNGLTLENEATYQYSATTGRLETVANSADVFTYGYFTNRSLINTVTKAASGGNPVLVATRNYETTRDTLAAIEKNAGTIVRSKYDYSVVNGGVNSLGQRMGVQTTFNLGAGHFANAGDTAWGYDNLGQLTSANHGTEDTSDRAYRYDTIGNRLFSEKGAPQIPTTPGLNSTGYTPNSVNQYGAITSHSASGVAGTSAEPVFDDDGNMKIGLLSGTGGSSANRLDWDAENRLVQVCAADDTTVINSTLYDAQSRRIATTAGGTTILYLYDGFNCIAEYIGTTLAKTRTWGMDLSGIMQGAGGVGELLAEKQGANTFYPTYDGNGNVSEYVMATGAVATHFEYDPFGNIVKESYTSGFDASSFSYKFSTKPLDLITGLYFYLYRYYDPVTGRWPSRDPIEERGGANLYSYTSNQPTTSFDTLGLSATTVDGDPPTVTRGGSAMVIDASQVEGSGLTGPRIKSIALEVISKDSKCCVRFATVDYYIRAQISASFANASRFEYDMWKRLTIPQRYGPRPLTYDGLKAHEDTHVKQYESIADVITNDIKETYSKMKCFDTPDEASAEHKKIEEMYKKERWHDSNAVAAKFAEKFPGKEGMKPGEYEAIVAEEAVYDEHYK